MDKTKKQLITYVAVTFALTWAYGFGPVRPGLPALSVMASDR